MAYPEQLQPDTCKYRIGTNKVSGGQKIFSRVPTLANETNGTATAKFVPLLVTKTVAKGDQA
jgi:hypothetical protein